MVEYKFCTIYFPLDFQTYDNFILHNTIELIIRNVVTILFQYFNAYSNYITRAACSLYIGIRDKP